MSRCSRGMHSGNLRRKRPRLVRFFFSSCCCGGGDCSVAAALDGSVGGSAAGEFGGESSMNLAARAKEFPFEKGVVRRELFQLQLQLGNRRLLRPHDSL
ncbi:MAG: hypothetical protein U1A77_00470 [Pirellulales bacterium]